MPRRGGGVEPTSEHVEHPARIGEVIEPGLSRPDRPQPPGSPPGVTHLPVGNDLRGEAGRVPTEGSGLVGPVVGEVLVGEPGLRGAGIEGGFPYERRPLIRRRRPAVAVGERLHLRVQCGVDLARAFRELRHQLDGHGNEFGLPVHHRGPVDAVAGRELRA